MTEGFSKDTAQQRTYRAFETLLTGEDAEIDLAQAALLIASSAYPDLDITHYLAQLDVLARRVRTLLSLPSPDLLPQLPADTELSSVLTTINKVLLEEEHFYGNKENYYNADNSFLNKVLDDHCGLPIMLSLLYMEVGKRVGIQIDGIAFPYHFMVRCRLPQGTVYIDPFTDGTLMSERECVERIRQIAQRRIKFHAQWFEPVGHKQMLTRILNNLKHVYIEQEDYARALTICDLILLISPQAALERRARGHLHLQLKHYARALHDLSLYLELAPQADDRYEIRNSLKMIRQIMSMLN